MKAFFTLAVIAVFLFVLLSGCTSQSSADDGYSGFNVQMPDDVETIDTGLDLGSDLAPADDYANSMDNDLISLQDNSEPDSNMGLGEL